MSCGLWQRWAWEVGNCMYMYACMHVCMYACMHVCMYAGMHVCRYACMHYACMYACMHVCMYACMYVCMYVYIYIHSIIPSTLAFAGAYESLELSRLLPTVSPTCCDSHSICAGVVLSSYLRGQTPDGISRLSLCSWSTALFVLSFVC